MNKLKDKTMSTLRLAVVCAVLAGGLFSTSALAQVDYALLVQQTPVDGGSVTPDTGVHTVAADGAVTVTATPKAGYQFAYWLGDVADPAANSTVVSLNAPKIVVAVFERSKYDLPLQTLSTPDGSDGGGGRLVPNRGTSLNGGGDVSPAGPQSSSSSFNYPNSLPQPVPPPPADSGDPYQVPKTDQTPEPATMLLLGIGSLLVVRRKK